MLYYLTWYVLLKVEIFIQAFTFQIPIFFFFSIRCCSLLFILRIMFTILFPHSNLSFDGFSFLLIRPSLIKVNLNRLLMHDSDFMVIS